MALRHRRRRKRFEKVIPKPELVIEESSQPSVSLEGLEPSRARERAVYDPTPADDEIVEALTDELLDLMGVDCELGFEHAEYQRVFIDVEKRGAGILIGRHGATIDAIELLLGRMASHRAGHSVPVQVDVNDYRLRHEEELAEEARSLAARVLETGQDEHLPPMRARDRRVVHLIIQDMEGLNTYSLGEGSLKHIVIHREGDAGQASED